MSKKEKIIPLAPLPIIETHFHLDYLKALSQDEIVKKSKEYNVEKMITISVEPDNFDAVMDLTAKYPEVFGTQGIHPHDASLFTEETLEKVKTNTLKNPKIVAIGEIGLDYFYTKSPREKQLECFDRYLELAIELNKPVVIHTRDADEDTIAILKNASKNLKRKGVLHSFTSSMELAEYALSEGFYLGINGICTFPNAANVREVIAMAPMDRLLLETDAPFLTPAPFRGVENAPYYLSLVALKIAEVKALEYEIVLKKAYQNSVNLFNF